VADEAVVSVHASVLMTNHVHLLMTSKQAAGFAEVMKRLASATSSASIGPMAVAGDCSRGGFAPR
jgi:REP element-mobilizing transposase RayT